MDSVPVPLQILGVIIGIGAGWIAIVMAVHHGMKKLDAALPGPARVLSRSARFAPEARCVCGVPEWKIIHREQLVAMQVGDRHLCGRDEPELIALGLIRLLGKLGQLSRAGHGVAGHWVDGTLGFRFEVDLSLWVTPYIKAQYIKILEENGVGNNTEFFMGAGLSAGWELGEDINLLLDYSYLANESREPVSSSADTFGEHRLFFGLQARFGAQRRF